MKKENLLKKVLQEAKKQKLKWILQSLGENLFPNEKENLDYYNIDKWIYSDNINKTLKFMEDIGNHADIVFNNGDYIRFIDHYQDLSEIENFSDYTIENKWIDQFVERHTPPSTI